MFGFRKEIKEDRKKNVIISVWGSPASGKTTVAAKLAKMLSEQKINTVLVLNDSIAPMFPCIVPPNEIEEEHSLGELLSRVNISQTEVKNHLVLLKRNPYLSILGYLKGENSTTHPPYTHLQVEEMIDSLKEIAAVIIFDCTSSLDNTLTTTAILNSDFMLNVINCDLKSISFLSSQLSTLYDKGFDADIKYNILSNVKGGQNSLQMAKSVGKIAFELEHSGEVEEQYLNGDLFEDLTYKNSRNFRKEIKNIINEMIEV